MSNQYNGLSFFRATSQDFLLYGTIDLGEKMAFNTPIDLALAKRGKYEKRKVT